MAIEMLEIRHTGVRFDVERIRRYGSPPRMNRMMAEASERHVHVDAG